MKRIFYLSLTILLSSCLTEKNADPGKPTTFVRYFNGGNNDTAQLAEETSDGGIIILGTTEIANEDATKRYKIKLIKTDEYGNLQWQNVYPSDFSSTAENIKASSLLQLPTGGYLIIGTIILPTKTEMYLMEVGADGSQKNERTIDFIADVDSLSVKGHAIQLNSNGNYLVLGATSDVTKNMILAELDKSSPKPIQVRTYGTGPSVLSNKIYLDAAENIVWSGTVTTTSSDIRFAKVTKATWGPLNDDPIGKSDLEESGNDMCRYANGFAIVGSTNEKISGTTSSTGDQDILFKILAEDGTELLSKPIPASSDTDTGNAIASVRGGLVILGTVKVGGQDDYYLAKYDAFGNPVWEEARIFGNTSKNDKGASVRQLSDGSLLVLGTTNFGGVETMMLMKADSEGNIE